MSFYTSLTGLNAATAMLGVTSNNIANVGTTGFKRSRADFGDIFATSPLQKASSTVGQGVSLKQVSQEFSQGNISFSSNALDLAVTGDGFFPMRSSDGLQESFTRNGSFLLNEQFNVVNSAGQRLMASTVDSTGSANVNERVVLTIPQKTSGEAKQTSEVALGLNFPADASVITAAFNRANPATFNKSTAFTVYDNGGNGYLATIYYVKAQNANQASPYNKWETHVFIGSDEVSSSLQQSTNKNGEKMYVDQYGNLAAYSDVKLELTTNKTQMFTLNQLTDVRTSVPATVTGTPVDIGAGINFQSLAAQDPAYPDLLKNMFSISVDGSAEPVTIDLSNLATSNQMLTGSAIAAEVTNQLNKKFGDEKYFDFNSVSSQSFFVTDSGVTDGIATPDHALGLPIQIPIKLDATMPELGGTSLKPANLSRLTIGQVESAIQAQLDLNNTSAGPNTIKVDYDYGTQCFKFVDAKNTITLSANADPTTAATNDVMGLTNKPVTLDEFGAYASKVIPNSTQALRSSADQRYGMSMVYDSVNKSFKLLSGTTGDKSSLVISSATANALTQKYFGLSDQSVDQSLTAVRGVPSQPAVATGTTPTVNINNNFPVDTPANSTFVVTVDGVKGVVTIPQKPDYSLDTFMQALQDGINSLGSTTGTSGSPTTVNGVKVTYDAVNKNFVFKTSTTTSDSFITISGDKSWGLDNVTATRGSTSTWIKPTQHSGEFIDSNGKETTSSDGYTTLPKWSPIYLDKGELTFDTGGKLVSPLAGTQLETVFLAGGKGALTININYSASTQYTSPFAVLSQSQDGAPEGDLVGVTIGNDGLVSASFSNGSQKSLAKILLVNFSSPVGLRQIGDSSFLASAASGKPILGTAGSAGFGTLRAGATERANVDLTQELVDLITAQRNFQANAKAIETSTTMTSAIINMRAG